MPGLALPRSIIARLMSVAVMATSDGNDRDKASVTTPVPAAVSRTRRGRSPRARSATTSAYGAKFSGTR